MTDRPHAAREMVLLFLGAVALCGVFFSLGFLVGFKEKNVLPSLEILKSSGSPPAPSEGPSAKGNPKTDRVRAASETRKVPLSFNGTEQEKKASARLERPDTVTASTRVPSSRTSPSRTVSKKKPGQPQPVPSGFAVQVAALLAQKDAESVHRVLKAKNYRVFIVQPQYAEANDNLFRVQVGPFLTREEAEGTRDRLAQEGFSPFIRK